MGPPVFKTGGATLDVTRWVRLPCAPANLLSCRPVGAPRRDPRASARVDRAARTIEPMTTLESPPSPSPLRLTDLTDCGGCAAKLGADLLAEALAGLGAQVSPPELLAGLDPPDDAAVYRISDEVGIVGTLDFFPPLVDDPRTYGEIAAANALSRRLRDGRASAVRPVDRRLPGGSPARRDDGHPRRRLDQGPRGRRHPRRRPHDQRRRAEVRARGHRRRPPRPDPSQGRRPTGRSPLPHEAPRDRAARQRPSPGQGVRRRVRRRDPPDDDRSTGRPRSCSSARA